MPDLGTELRENLQGKTLLIGVGNPDWGDDGFGVRLAEAMMKHGVRSLIGGNHPEKIVHLIPPGVDHVLLLDAVEIPAPPGSTVFMNSTDLHSRFPQISTHKLSLGALARLIQDRSGARVWLLGVKAESLRASHSLSGPVAQALAALQQLLMNSIFLQRPETWEGDRESRNAGGSTPRPDLSSFCIPARCG